MAAVERATTDTSTLWAATTNGRVFITSNADADPASSVAFVRLDSLASNDPDRYVTGIFIDPDNANHAWISYSGFTAATPSTPGHIFSVTYDPGNGTATWTSLDGSLGDLPLTDVVQDADSGDVYVSSDFGVLKSGGGPWTVAAPGMPNVEVAGLTYVPGDGTGITRTASSTRLRTGSEPGSSSSSTATSSFLVGVASGRPPLAPRPAVVTPATRSETRRGPHVARVSLEHRRRSPTPWRLASTQPSAAVVDQ